MTQDWDRVSPRTRTDLTPFAYIVLYSRSDEPARRALPGRQAPKCLSQDRPDLRVQYVAVWLKPKGRRQSRRLRAARGTRRDGGVRKDACRRDTRKPAVLGIVPIRQGRRPSKVANPGGTESVPVGARPKLEGARESDRLTGHSRTELCWLRVPCVSAPSF